MSVSLAQGKYCDANQLDPEDPRCAHVILTGRMQKVITVQVQSCENCPNFHNVKGEAGVGRGGFCQTGAVQKAPYHAGLAERLVSSAHKRSFLGYN